MESQAHDFDGGGSGMGGDGRIDGGPRSAIVVGAGIVVQPAGRPVIAEQITTGKQPEVLRPFDPRRRAVA